MTKHNCAILKLLADMCPVGTVEIDTTFVAALAGLINAIVQDPRLKEYLVSWLATGPGVSLTENMAIRRAVVTVVAQDREQLVQVLEKAMGQFGDQLYIKHTPMLHQQGM